MAMRLPIERSWDGEPLPEGQQALVELRGEPDALVIAFDAPYFGDPPPPTAAGPTDRLWDYELVELFVADATARYLEVELGPHGHQLVLQLDGVRQIVRQGLPLDYTVRIEPARSGAAFGRYRGQARVPRAYLPERPVRVNAYAIHGLGAERSYCAHAPVPGAHPDFHRLDRFVPLAPTLLPD